VVLARSVPGFALPGEAVPEEQPTLLRAANPARPAAGRTHPRVARLIFDPDRFRPSDARSWCKAHRYHPGVPQIGPDGVVIEQAGGRGARRVALDRGVVAEVAA
jgi:hypothetical protein